MQKYLNQLHKVITEGHMHEDRTGVGRQSVFGLTERYDLTKGFPAVTTRALPLSSIIAELLWMISGSVNNNVLLDKDCKFWDRWALSEADVDAFVEENLVNDGVHTEEEVEQARGNLKQLTGSLGPIYGAMWRNAPQPVNVPYWPKIAFADIPWDKRVTLEKLFNEAVQKKLEEDPSADISAYDLEDFCCVNYRRTVDQLNELVLGLRDRPYSSRHVVTAWVPSEVSLETLSPGENVILMRGALAPCHVMFQCFVSPPKEEGGKPRLSLMMTQRSADMAIGVPSNIVQYSLLLSMLAHVTGMEAYEFIHSIGDAHLYADQIELAKTQLERAPNILPALWLNPAVTSLFDFTVDDIKFAGYEAQEAIKYPLAK